MADAESAVREFIASIKPAEHYRAAAVAEFERHQARLIERAPSATRHAFTDGDPLWQLRRLQDARWSEAVAKYGKAGYLEDPAYREPLIKRAGEEETALMHRMAADCGMGADLFDRLLSLAPTEEVYDEQVRFIFEAWPLMRDAAQAPLRALMAKYLRHLTVERNGWPYLQDADRSEGFTDTEWAELQRLASEVPR